MKFSYILSAAALSARPSTSVMGAPVNITSVVLPSSSTSISNSTNAFSSSTTSQSVAAALVDAMSGVTTTTSITIIGQNSTKNSTNHFVGTASVTLHITIISSVLLL